MTDREIEDATGALAEFHERGGKTLEQIKSELTVQVKPLVWEHERAEAFGNVYELFDDEEAGQWNVDFITTGGYVLIEGLTNVYYKTEEYAKAAAQAHHEKLILGALL